MSKYSIKTPSKDIYENLKHKINNKTKPIGSLGTLEDLAIKIGLIQNTLEPRLTKPAIVVFAGDHGIASEGVSLYPQEVTYQMVLNFLNSGAAINVFCRQNNIQIKVVDAGVKHDFDTHPDLIMAKVAYGTKSFLNEPAMTDNQYTITINEGARIANMLYQEGSNIIGFGEMGIANTSSSAIIFSLISGIPIEECVGRGTGLDDSSLLQKKKILRQAIINQNISNNPNEIMKTFGGFEINMMTGAMLKAAELHMTLMVDGFISTSAFIAAAAIEPAIIDYAIFCHQSDEQGHKLMLDYLKVKPLLNLGLRLGEGTGAALAYPIINSAVAFLNEMASFESASVSKTVDEKCLKN